MSMTRPMAYAIALCCALVWGFALSCAAEANVADPARVAELDTALDEVLASPAYQWRLPRELRPVDPDAETGWFVSALEQTVRAIGRVVRWLTERIADLIQWIAKRLFPAMPEIERFERGDRWRDNLQAIYGLVVILSIGLLLWLVVRALWMRRKQEEPPSETEAAIDLEDEQITADRLPVSEWLSMARELQRDGNLRHTMRALFLAALASLGQRGWVRIARHKSNRDYARELEQRAQEELYAAYTGHMRLFERSWYGDYPVTPTDIEEGEHWLQRIMGDEKR